MTLAIKSVTPVYVHQIWSEIETYLAEALKWGEDDYTVDQAKVYLANGDWVLIVAVDETNKIHGAAAVRFNNMPNSRVAFVIAMGGRLISNKDTYEQFCSVLKSFGATKIQGAARDSVARLWTRYGFRERYKIVEAKI